MGNHFRSQSKNTGLVEENGSLLSTNGWRSTLEDTNHVLENLGTTSLIVLSKYAPSVCHDNLHDLESYTLSTISYIAYKICYSSNSDSIQLYLKLYTDYINYIQKI